MKHTPKPWIIKHEFNVFQGDTLRSIASCGGHNSNVNSEQVYQENLANAKLVAAAPDLLEACKIAKVGLITDEHYQEFKHVIKILESAIQKAE